MCPVLLGDRAPLVTRVSIDSMDRRSVVLGVAAAAALGGSAALLAGATAGAGRLVGGAKKYVAPGQLGGNTTTTTAKPGSPTTTAPPNASGIKSGPATDVPVGGAANFQVPTSGDPGIVVQTTRGSFVAYDAVCPHAGCTVGYYSANKILACPCHGSTFALETGAVLGGPAPRGLTKLSVVEESDGNLYLK